MATSCQGFPRTKVHVTELRNRLLGKSLICLHHICCHSSLQDEIETEFSLLLHISPIIVTLFCVLANLPIVGQLMEFLILVLRIISLIIFTIQ